MYKLIIVDDEKSIRNGLCNYFPWEQTGFETPVQFDNGKSALNFLMKNKVHVALTDIRMPVMDGIEFAKQISERNLPVKVVFLTGYKDFEYAQNAIDYGVRSYILKPAKYQVLFDTFTKLKLELDKELDNNFNKRHKNIGNVNFNITDNIKTFIINNIHNVTLENVAEKFHMNPYYLSSFFHNQTGEKFYDYVLRIKMESAAELLCKTNKKIQEISFSVGYTNANSFSRAFRNYFNISPTEYRLSKIT